MRRFAHLILLLAWLSLLLSGCGLQAQSGPMTFDQLARWVPNDVEQAFFLNLKPSGQAGSYWQRIYGRLAANPQARPAVDSLFDQFRAHDFGLDPFIVGPAVNGYFSHGQYIILQVNSQSGARDAVLLQDLQNQGREREEYQGKTLYHGTYRYTYGQREYRALATFKGLLVLALSYDQDPIDDLKAVVDLPEEESLASLPSWKSLRARLPETPMGLIYLHPPEQIEQPSQPGSDVSMADVLGRQIEALALAAVPEPGGMRVEMAADLATQSALPPQILNLLNLPGVDPASWTGLPADTALALSSRDAATVWPVLRDMFGGLSLDQVVDVIGLDLEADLFAADGPLSGDFALAITPPLPDQPISQGIAAAQFLILARDASPAQMAAVQAAMEGRGATFSSQTVEGVGRGIELQTQVGTALAGYAVSFGFDGDVLLLGSSPGIIDRSVSARRDGTGLVADPAFRAVLNTMPKEPAFFVYLNRPSLTEMLKANMTEDQYNQSQEYEAFEAISLGLTLSMDRIDGTLYFYMPER
jgi:hypothetical protein